MLTSKQIKELEEIRQKGIAANKVLDRYIDLRDKLKGLERVKSILSERSICNLRTQVGSMDSTAFNISDGDFAAKHILCILHNEIALVKKELDEIDCNTI